VPALPSAASAAESAVLQALAGVDSIRSRAYSERRPELLAAIYGAAALRAADAARLMAVVPSGCGLFGMSTLWTVQHASMTGTRHLQARVAAQVSAAELRCRGIAPTRTEAPPASTIEIVLVRGSSGQFVIESERVV
jgi:hypothetical protein